jgi:hypothetical protein
MMRKPERWLKTVTLIEEIKKLRFKKLNLSWVNAYSLPWGKGESRLEQVSK